MTEEFTYRLLLQQPLRSTGPSRGEGNGSIASLRPAALAFEPVDDLRHPGSRVVR